MKTTVKFGATLLLASILIFGACKKKKVVNEQDEDISGNNTQMESEEAQYRDEEAGASADCNFDWSQVTGTCATITQSSVEYPKVVTIDYGTTGCTDAKGRLKKGKIIFSISANRHTVGATRIVTFEGFSVNGKSITGTRQAENIGENANGNIEIRVTGSITAVNAEGKTHSRTFNRVREWTAGYATCTHTDDEFSITGSGTCTNNNGVTRNWIITSPLIVKPATCDYIMSGVINIGTETRGAIINYGTGTCDNLATLLNKRTNVTYILNLDTHQIQ
jgi:hypothetical protein